MALPGYDAWKLSSPADGVCYCAECMDEVAEWDMDEDGRCPDCQPEEDPEDEEEDDSAHDVALPGLAA